MTWKSGLGLAALTLVAAAVRADDTSVRYDVGTERTRVVETTDRSWCAYKCNELSFDVFGTGTVGKHTLERASIPRFKRNGRLGLGVGFEYFPLRYLGVEAEAYTESTAHNWVDNIDGNLIARFPILDTGLAIYGFGGGGRQLDPVYQWTWDAGGGLEWRFSPHVGVFADARYVWAQHTEDYGLGRVGLRVGF